MDLNRNLLDRVAEGMRSDPELAVVGKFFSCSFLLMSGQRRYLCRVLEGKVAELLVDPSVFEPWQFAIKAPPETWERFLEEIPPPGYHDIWAAAFAGNMFIEGDTKVLMQHHNALWRTLRLLRETAVSTASPAAGMGASS